MWRLALPTLKSSDFPSLSFYYYLLVVVLSIFLSFVGFAFGVYRIITNTSTSTILSMGFLKNDMNHPLSLSLSLSIYIYIHTIYIHYIFSTVKFSKYKFYNKLLSGVILLKVTLYVTWTLIYIYENNLLLRKWYEYNFFYNKFRKTTRFTHTYLFLVTCLIKNKMFI